MEPTGVLRCKSAVCGLKRPAPNASRRCPVHLNPRSRIALLLLRPLSVGRFASLRFRPKNMAHIFFSSKPNFKIFPGSAPKASLSFSVSEKPARYGSSALSGVEHLRCCGISVLLKRCLAPVSKAKERRSWQLSRLQCADAEHALSAPQVSRRKSMEDYGRVTSYRGMNLTLPFVNSSQSECYA